MKCFQYQMLTSVKRSEKQLSSKRRFFPILQRNCSNFTLKQCEKPEIYLTCQKKLSLKKSGTS